MSIRNKRKRHPATGMRISGGRFRGRVFYPPANLPARPTTDFARSALFNILQNYYDFPNIRVLDLFAGTGFISFEFLSRGAREVIAVDKDSRCIAFIQRVREELGLENLKTVRVDAFRFLQGYADQFDVIFAGPPYGLGDARIRRIHEYVFRYERLTPEGTLIIEHSRHTPMDDLPHLVDQRTYGSSVFSFYRAVAPSLIHD